MRAVARGFEPSLEIRFTRRADLPRLIASNKRSQPEFNGSSREDPELGLLGVRFARFHAISGIAL